MQTCPGFFLKSSWNVLEICSVKFVDTLEPCDYTQLFNSYVFTSYMSVYTGSVDDECLVASEDRDWYTYWRLLFAKVDENDIVNFETNYKGKL